jgi:beta-lactamase superfamily II metal-dependent hydrolase
MIRYVNKNTTPMYRKQAGDDVRSQLLWGDRVRVINQGSNRWKVRARGATGFVPKSVLGTKSLLEFYFIDVGQGDGVLIRTPDDRHILIDGGWPRSKQPTNKNAGDFVDWKFKRDYERDVIDLDAVICSHNDQDHYGGLWDLFNTSKASRAELNCTDVTAEAIYHAGLSWWVKSGGRTLGPYVMTTEGSMFTRLLGDRASVEAALKSQANPKLQGEWAKFWKQAVKTKTRSGTKTPIQRLSHDNEFLPGFDDPQGVRIKVLGPVEFGVDGKAALRRLDSSGGQNTNGNSVLLRVDFDKTRVLLTGDLNQKAQDALLLDYDNQHGEFKADVSKGCHHGSADVSFKFLNKIKPTVTILSSGDSEGHDHPTPEVIAGSGITGNRKVDGDVLQRPLVYITELARSVFLGTPQSMAVTLQDGSTLSLSGDDLKKVKVTYKIRKAGGSLGTKTVQFHRDGKTHPRQMVDWTTFGLVNVRTDGKKLLIAARNEADMSWNYDVVEGRF